MPVLTTKLYVPPLRSELVSRPRLIERLNDGLRLGTKLTLVSAPAGFGKTTLLSEWVTTPNSRTSVAWVSLDEDDNDLSRFLTYVVVALQQVDAHLGEACQANLQAPQPPPVEPLITALINDLAASDGQLVLIFDDYHTITLPAIHEAMTFLLDHMPHQLHLVIASRADPPLALSRLRVRRQITEIRAIDLRFSETEAAAFLNRVMKLDLSPEEIGTIEHRTEGWIAGLQLAALSMESLRDARRHDFIAALSGDDRYILDYLVEEVLDRQPVHIQAFLLRTSILERLYGPLCDAVLDDGQVDDSPISAQEILGYLDHNNLFLVPLDNRRCWYRYHHLFADLLRNQLKASQPDLVPALHRRASTWYAANGLRSEAIAHSLAAEDWEQAAELIERAMNDMMGQGEYFTTMLNRLKALPEEVIRARPHFGISYAWLLQITLRLDEVEPRLQQVEKMCGDRLTADLRLEIDVIRASLARQRRNLAEAMRLSHKVLDALPSHVKDDNPLQRESRIGIVFDLGHTYLCLKGNVAEGGRYYAEALELSRAAGSLTLILVAIAGLAQVHVVRGQLSQAVEAYWEGLALAESDSHGQPAQAAAYMHVGLAEVLRERNELNAAARHLARGLDICRRWRVGDTWCDALLIEARLRRAQGDVNGAWDAIRRAEGLPYWYQAVPRYTGPVAVCRALLALEEADAVVGSSGIPSLDPVEEWVVERGFSTDDQIASLDDEREHLVWARLLIAQGKADQALGVLGRLSEAAEQHGRAGRTIEIRTIRALAEQALGDTEGALATLAGALALAEPERYVRTFVDKGAPMAALLRSLSLRRSAPTVSPEYINQLLDAFGSIDAIETPPERELEPSRFGALPLEALTDREMEVLRLLSTELSGPEIARELCVSVNTVKTHTKRIYDKLGAHSRYEALDRAQELGLI